MRSKKTEVKEFERTFALRCYIDGKRKKTDQLTVEEARIFRHAARHLARYLGKEYHLGK